MKCNLKEIEKIISQKVLLVPGILGFANREKYIKINEQKNGIELNIFIKCQDEINFIQVARQLQKLLKFELNQKIKIKGVFFINIYIDDIKVI